MPAPTGYIDDYAGVISGPAKSDMEDLARELHNKTKAQIFLVTIKTLEDEPVETFANELFAKWKIGEKKTDRGVLLLFAISDHKRWIEVGYGLEGILNDAKVGDIGRKMVPALREANYDDATRLGLREISRVIATDSAVKLDNLDNLEDTTQAADAAPPPPTVGAPSSENPSAARWLLIPYLLFPALFIGFIIFAIVRAIRTGATGNIGSAHDGGSTLGSSESFNSSGNDSGGSDSFNGGDGGSSGGGGAGGDW
jgi:uncharacterized protein